MDWEGLLGFVLEQKQKAPTPTLPFAFGEREGARLGPLPLA